MSNITAYQGNTRNVEVTVTTTAGAAYDLAGLTCKLIVSKNRGDITPKFVKTAASEDISNNVVVFRIATSDLDIAAGTYAYEVVIVSGNPASRSTVAQGDMIILESLNEPAAEE